MQNKYFSFQKKFKIIYLIILFCLTIFFLIHAFNIKINADFSTIFNQVDSTIYEVNGDFNQDEINSLLANYKTLQKIDSLKIANESIPEEFNENKKFSYQYNSKTQNDLEQESSILLMIQSKNFFTPLFLNTLDDCLINLKNLNTVQNFSSVFDYFTIERNGSRLKISPISNHKQGTLWTDEEVSELKLKIASDPTITGYLVSQNLDSIIFSVNTSYLNESEIYGLLKIFEPLNKFNTNFAITGALPINHRIFYYLTHDLTLLLSLCFFVILIVFYFSFKAKRSMLLPLSLSIIAIIWTFGTMSLLGIPITIINIITPCMVLVLGSSYSVHIVSEYYSNYSIGIRNHLAAKSATKIYKTIILAGLTTIAGFISLIISKVDGLKEFGIIVSIGIIYCIILSLTFLPIILSLIPHPKTKQTNVVEKGILTTLIKKISNIIIKYWIVFCILYIGIIVGFILTKNKVNVDTNYMSYFPNTDRIVQDTKEISTIFGGDIPYSVTIEAPQNSEKYFLDPENLKKVHDFENIIIKSPDILQNISFSSYVAYLNKLYTSVDEIPSNTALLNLFSKLIIILKNNNAGLIGQTISEDYNKITIFFQCYDSSNNDITTISSSKNLEELIIASVPLLPSDCQVIIGGTNSQALNFSNQLLKDQSKSQIIAYLLVFIIATLAFKSIFRGLLTLIPVSVGVMANYIFMYILKIPFDMVTVSFASIAIGAGVDDAIHFLLKYSTLLDKGHNNYNEALIKTIKITGRPIILTTLSIVLGMLMLTFGSYMPIKYFGILMSVALMNSMLATIFILPSIIIMVEKLKHKFMKSL